MPAIMAFWSRARRRQKGLDALTRGMVAAGAGDVRLAGKSAREAEKHLGDQPLALLLRAQAAQLGGDREAAERAFHRMLDKPETRILGLRGLHIEALRRGDSTAAHGYAAQAHEIAPLGWAAQAVLEHHSRQEDWTRALATVEANHRKKVIDGETARRQRAVLQTAIAAEIAERDPQEALRLAREARKQSPELAPASVLVGRLLTRGGHIRRAARVLEAAWRLAPHPDIGRAYVDVRPGESANDRLQRARALARFSPEHPESRMLVARAALEARDFAAAREAMAPLISEGARPTVRACLLMADIEETEHGPGGALREWLARATRAPRDPTWIADGFASDTWSPVSPVTGRLDAFVWQTPPERLTEAPAIVTTVETPALAAPATPAEPDPVAAPAEVLPAAEAVAPAPIPAPKAETPSLRGGFAYVDDAVAPPDDPGPRLR
jgi:HemY protein